MYFQICHHGYLSLNYTSDTHISDEPSAFPLPDRMLIAPYWSDIDIPNSFLGHLYYREVKEGPELLNATYQVRKHIIKCIITTRKIVLSLSIAKSHFLHRCIEKMSCCYISD
jgi:hypothetical protein